ncbi:MAG: hypothetical protein FJ088_07035, partial [Deltaproteobacteria bacterium]|nr:hypothetical protein [Deltaproteobacteria bacterium]
CMSTPDVLCYDGEGNPTGAAECNNQNTNYCKDNGATYVVRIYRESGSAANCDETQYTVEFSNGAYSP